MFRAAVKIPLFILSIVALQLGVGAIRASVSPIPLRDLADQALARKDAVIYFGDSVIASRHPEDVDRRTIAEMLQEELGGRRVGLVNQHGLNPTLMQSLTAYLVRRGGRPEWVVVPINLRSFSPVTDLRPQYQYVTLRLRLDHDDLLVSSWSQPLASFHRLKLDPVSQRQFEETPVYRGATQVGRIRDFEGPEFKTFSSDKLAKKFVVDYMYPLQADHRQVRSILDVADRCLRAGIRPLFYVTPVDVESGVDAVGPEFRSAVQSNTQLLRDLLSARGLDLLDLSLGLDKEAFDWKRVLYPNEHLTERGRRFVAEQVARRLAP